MAQFEGFKNTKGEIVLTSEELLDKYQGHFQEHGFTPDAREQLKQQLLLQNNNADYVESAIKWADEQFNTQEVAEAPTQL